MTTFCEGAFFVLANPQVVKERSIKLYVIKRFIMPCEPPGKIMCA